MGRQGIGPQSGRVRGRAWPDGRELHRDEHAGSARGLGDQSDVLFHEGRQDSVRLQSPLSNLQREPQDHEVTIVTPTDDLTAAGQWPVGFDSLLGEHDSLVRADGAGPERVP